jgi:hypothetical protein
MSKTFTDSWSRKLYWTPTILLCAGMIYSSIYWLTTAGPPAAIAIAEQMKAPNTWVFMLLPVGQLIAAIFILNRKLPTVRIFAYAFVLFYNVQLLLLLLNGEQNSLAALETFKIAIAAWAYFADRNRIAKSSL